MSWCPAEPPASIARPGGRWPPAEGASRGGDRAPVWFRCTLLGCLHACMHACMHLAGYVVRWRKPIWKRAPISLNSSQAPCNLSAPNPQTPPHPQAPPEWLHTPNSLRRNSVSPPGPGPGSSPPSLPPSRPGPAPPLRPCQGRSGHRLGAHRLLASWPWQDAVPRAEERKRTQGARSLHSPIPNLRGTLGLQARRPHCCPSLDSPRPHLRR